MTSIIPYCVLISGYFDFAAILGLMSYGAFSNDASDPPPNFQPIARLPPMIFKHVGSSKKMLPGVESREGCERD